MAVVDAKTRHYEVVLETTWPVNVGDLEWACRYTRAERLTAYRYVVASVVAAYDALTDTRISEREAIDKLKRARQAQRQAELRGSA